MIIVEGRCGNVDHDIRLLLYQYIHRADPVQRVIAQVPDIFTYRKCNTVIFKRDHVPFKARLKVPVLIKYIVRG